MVVPTVEQPSETYLLWKIFILPGENGGNKVFAVETDVAEKLISAFTVLVKASLISLWSIVTAAVAFLLLRQEQSHHLTASLWNHRASIVNQLYDVLAAGAGRFKNSARRWRYPLPLAVVASIVVALVAQVALAIVIAPLIVLDQAAPVNPDALYLPVTANTSDIPKTAKRVELKSRWALRAAAAALSADKRTANKVDIQIDGPVDRGDGEKDISIDYSFQVTGAEMGLQKLHDLILHVEGSCRTNYTWFAGSTEDNNGVTVDTYQWFGDIAPVNVSRNDGWAPYARFALLPSTKDKSNQTWGVIVSSVGRRSFVAGSDPWYRTQPRNISTSSTSNQAGFIVRSGRPVLSCWDETLFEYDGQKQPASGLSKIDSIQDHITPDIHRVLIDRFGQPIVVDVGLALGTAALASNQATWGSSIPADDNSVERDLRRLLLTTYIASTNVFTDLTLYSDKDKQALPNYLNISNGEAVEGADQFVVWSSHISTLSLAGVIVIPAVSLLFWAILLIVLSRTALKSVSHVYDAGAIFKKLERESDMHIMEGRWTKLSKTRDSGIITDMELRTNLPENSSPEVDPFLKSGARVSSSATEPTRDIEKAH